METACWLCKWQTLGRFWKHPDEVWRMLLCLAPFLLVDAVFSFFEVLPAFFSANPATPFLLLCCSYLRRPGVWAALIASILGMFLYTPLEGSGLHESVALIGTALLIWSLPTRNRYMQWIIIPFSLFIHATILALILDMAGYYPFAYTSLHLVIQHLWFLLLAWIPFRKLLISQLEVPDYEPSWLLFLLLLLSGALLAAVCVFHGSLGYLFSSKSAPLLGDHSNWRVYTPVLMALGGVLAIILWPERKTRTVHLSSKKTGHSYRSLLQS